MYMFFLSRPNLPCALLTIVVTVCRRKKNIVNSVTKKTQVKVAKAIVNIGV